MTAEADTSSPTIGELRLRVQLVGSRTVITDLHRTAPFVVCPPSYRGSGGHAEVIIQQTGPGLLPGDVLQIAINVEPGAKLTVRPQSATRLFPCASDQLIEVRAAITLGEGAELRFLPGELIPYRDSRFLQSTRVELADDSRMAISEVITPGRIAMAEVELFRELDLRLRINRKGDPLLIERALLDPINRPLSVPGRHGGFPISGSLYVIGSTAPLPGQTNDASVLTGIDRRGELTSFRLLGRRPDTVRNQIESMVSRLL